MVSKCSILILHPFLILFVALRFLGCWCLWAGVITEYDSPTTLLENKSSAFARLVAEYSVGSSSRFEYTRNLWTTDGNRGVFRWDPLEMMRMHSRWFARITLVLVSSYGRLVLSFLKMPKNYRGDISFACALFAFYIPDDAWEVVANFFIMFSCFIVIWIDHVAHVWVLKIVQLTKMNK